MQILSQPHALYWAGTFQEYEEMGLLVDQFLVVSAVSSYEHSSLTECKFAQGCGGQKLMLHG